MISITGASGQLGVTVTAALSQRVPTSEIRLGTRTPSKLPESGQQGIEVVYADFDKPKSLVQLFDRVESVLLISGTASNDVRIRQHRDVIIAARHAGVSRLVYTSFVNPVLTSLFPYSVVHANTEAYLRESGLNYVLLRNNQYFENLDHALAHAFKTGILSLPGTTGKVAYICRQELGEATAAVLADPSLRNVQFDLTGAQALSLHDVAEEATKVWGRPVHAQEMPLDEYRSALEGRGLPSYAIEGQVGIRLAAHAGEHARITDDAKQLVQRPLKTMRDYLGVFLARQQACI